MPNPIEATREAGERALEWTKQAAEDAREVGEDALEVATGWRRRRAIGGGDDVFMAKETALALLKHSRSLKAADICFSVQGL